MNPEELATQLIDLQSRVAHQEHTLIQLDQVITRQDELIAKLEARLTRLVERLDATGEGACGDPAGERPPHY